MSDVTENARALYKRHLGGECTEQEFDDHYIGNWPSLDDWAQDYTRARKFVPWNIFHWAQSMQDRGNIVVLDGRDGDRSDGVHLFWGHQ